MFNVQACLWLGIILVGAHRHGHPPMKRLCSPFEGVQYCGGINFYCGGNNYSAFSSHPQYWISSTVLVVSPTTIIVSLHSTEHPPEYWKVSLHSTKHPPMNWWYTHNTDDTYTQSTGTYSTVVNILHSTTQTIYTALKCINLWISLQWQIYISNFRMFGYRCFSEGCSIRQIFRRFRNSYSHFRRCSWIPTWSVAILFYSFINNTGPKIFEWRFLKFTNLCNNCIN